MHSRKGGYAYIKKMDVLAMLTRNHMFKVIIILTIS